MLKMITSKKAFTLVELSIVIVIIGLIIAGVTAGRALVRDAKLRSVVSQVNQYKVALDAFRLQYNALPGDMTNATSYWNTTVTTTNGNGKNGIEWGGASDTNESTRAWQHLSLAGLIIGSYAGTALNVGSVPGYNVPQSPFVNGGYWFWTNSPRQYVIWGGTSTPAGPSQAAIISGKDASNIDRKIDDGLRTTGNITGGTGQLPAPSLSCGIGSSYRMTDDITCYLFFITSRSVR